MLAESGVSLDSESAHCHPALEMASLRIGIVGGSISGCSAAVLARAAGHRPEVFERSTQGLVGRGGGIGTPTHVFTALQQEGIIEQNFSHLTASQLGFGVRTPEEPDFGRFPWRMPFGFAVFHWNTLWRELRKRVPDDTYHIGHEVLSAETTIDGGARLNFNARDSRDFDLVLFADGYKSIGRQGLFPESKLEYRGYGLWRGLLPEAEMPPGLELTEGVMVRFSYVEGAGDMVMYLVPSQDGDSSLGNRMVNWAAYVPIPEEDLPRFMVDRDGVVRQGSIPPGKMSAQAEATLQTFMQANLPTHYATIVSRTTTTHMQLIYTANVPAYASGSIALVGDAGVVAQPFTGSGVFKGFNNAKDLVEALSSEGDLGAALERWNQQQLVRGNQLLALGEQMEDAFIWNRLDLSVADAEATKAWFTNAVTFPESFKHS